MTIRDPFSVSTAIFQESLLSGKNKTAKNTTVKKNPKRYIF